MTAEPRRGRGPRRADVPGTGPAAADGREPRVAGLETGSGAWFEAPGAATQSAGKARGSARSATAARAEPLGEHERWLLEQRPPHWG